MVDSDLHAHKKFLARGDDKARDKAREVSTAAIAEGGKQWDRYLKMIASPNVADAPGGSIVSRGNKDLPPWTGDPERMQAWVNAKLDAEHAKIDAAFDRDNGRCGES
ncbi:MAG: hypothetical protein WA728_03505, partial [Xanthobacteraceae bacterium]